MRKRLVMFLAIVTCGVLFLSNTAPAQDYTVTITNFKYEPKELTVPVGTTVTWVNKEGVHTIQGDKGEFRSPNMRGEEKFTFKFDKPGTYAYHCGFHGSAGGGNMAGKIVVTASKKKS